MTAAPKPGPYPMADRANIFGTLFISFYQKWDSGGDVNACKPTFHGLLRIAASKADPKFDEAYQAIRTGPDGKHRDLTINDMDAIVGECWKLMDRIGTWDWASLPESEQE